jgi:hypothetical protein
MEQKPLKTGDILIDRGAKEIGVLIRRYNIFDEEELVAYIEKLEQVSGTVWVWDIFWVGPGPWPLDRLQTYTEEGLMLLLETRVLKRS